MRSESQPGESSCEAKTNAPAADDDAVGREALCSLLKHLHSKIETLMPNLRGQQRASERMAVKSAGRIVFLRLADIDWIEAADNYVNVHLGDESHLLRETMSRVEARLSSWNFMRISRSAIVNIEHIKELQPMCHGEYVVVLRNGARLTLTRGYRGKLRELSVA